MKQSRTKLARLIADRTLRSGISRSLGTEIAAYLLTERRTSELESVLRDVQVDWAEAGQVEVIARSAHPLTTKLEADIGRRLKSLYPHAKRIHVIQVHDPAMIGGVRLQLADRQLDLSVRSKLDKFRQLATTERTT